MKQPIKKTKEIVGPPLLGQVVKGKIVARATSSVIVDLGVLGAGTIYGKEFQEAKEILKNLKVGEEIVVKIIELENEDGYRELSLKDAEKEAVWERLKEQKEKEELLPVKIIGANKGGLLTAVANIPAFLPVSQLSAEHYPRIEDGDPMKILRELQKFVGQTLEVKILDLSAREGKLILSEKAKADDKIKGALKNFKAGDVVEGEITGLAEFGAFIKFFLPNDKNFALEGLIHISELDWQLVESPSEIVKMGEKTKAQILEIKNNQVFLSLKSLKENPWQEIEKKYKKGDVVNGKVVKLNPFGAFVELEPKIRGLCHISEFGAKTKMEELLKIGESCDFEILSIEPATYRINLGLGK